MKRRIVLTHWNAGVFSSKSVTHLLPELVLYSLLYDEVLIREEDLITNRRITDLLSDPDSDNYEFFAELLASGIVKLLRLPVVAYPTGRRFDPLLLPVSARAEEHALRRSYKGKPWKPTRKETRLFARLDRVLVDHKSASRPHRDFPKGNRFAEELAHVLENSGSYGLGSHPLFGKIDPVTQERFVSFCRDPEEWQRFLRKMRAPSIIMGPEGGFFRSAAYQCSEFLRSPRRIRRLVESAYAATFCARERADGRYGGELGELPVRFDSSGARERAVETIVRVEVTPTHSVVHVPITSGMASVLQRTRESSAYAELQRVLRLIGSRDPEVAEGVFKDAWRNVATEFSEYLTTMLPARAHLMSSQYTMWLYVMTGVVGAILASLSPLGPDGVQIYNHSIEHYGHALLESYRGVAQAPLVRRTLIESAQLTCSNVKLNA